MVICAAVAVSGNPNANACCCCAVNAGATGVVVAGAFADSMRGCNEANVELYVGLAPGTKACVPSVNVTI